MRAYVISGSRWIGTRRSWTPISARLSVIFNVVTSPRRTTRPLPRKYASYATGLRACNRPARTAAAPAGICGSRSGIGPRCLARRPGRRAQIHAVLGRADDARYLASPRPTRSSVATGRLDQAVRNARDRFRTDVAEIAHARLQLLHGQWRRSRSYGRGRRRDRRRGQECALGAASISTARPSAVFTSTIC